MENILAEKNFWMDFVKIRAMVLYCIVKKYYCIEKYGVQDLFLALRKIFLALFKKDFWIGLCKKIGGFFLENIGRVLLASRKNEVDFVKKNTKCGE